MPRVFWGTLLLATMLGGLACLGVDLGVVDLSR